MATAGNSHFMHRVRVSLRCLPPPLPARNTSSSPSLVLLCRRRPQPSLTQAPRQQQQARILCKPKLQQHQPQQQHSTLLTTHWAHCCPALMTVPPACCCMSRHSTAAHGCRPLRDATDLNQQRCEVVCVVVCVGTWSAWVHACSLGVCLCVRFHEKWAMMVGCT